MAIPALLCGCMIAIGIAAAAIAGIGSNKLVLSYVETGVAFTVLAGLIFTFSEFTKLALRRADKPVSVVIALLRERAPLLVLPALMFPLLLAGYTTAKTAIPFLVGYGWDGFWADADHLVFRKDAWLLAIPLVEWAPLFLWEWIYSAGWGLVLFMWLATVPFYESKTRVGVMYTATFATWLIGGWLVAYSTSAAGPIFAHVVDPALADRFLPMREHLASTLSAEGPISRSQRLLSIALEKHVALTGAGISAMPSMHVAMTTIYVLAARRSWWIVPACAFWLIIFIGSAYFGYHYWLDGIVAAIITWLCWKAAESVFATTVSEAELPVSRSAVPESLAP